MSNKELNTSVTIPLLLIIAATLLQYLLPPIETVEKALISYLQYKWLLSVVKSLALSLVLLLPYYLFNRAINPLNSDFRGV
jgi:hypothetical protein